VARRAWNRQGLDGVVLWLGLLPFAVVTATVAWLRNLAYDFRLRRARRAGAAVVCVGNLTVGGTGKTPVVLWVAREFERRGRRVAILSRGYRRRSRGVHIVAAQGAGLVDVGVAGDEPAMLGKCIDGLVVVGERRVAAAAAAVERGADLLILDDGFQHRALARDFDLLLMDAARPFANGCTLPAGPLREPRRGARRAHAILLIDREPERAQVDAPGPAGPPTLYGRPCFRARLTAQALVVPDGTRWREEPLGFLAGQRTVAVSGVADAAAFYAMLRHWEANIVGVLEFPDHHWYDRDDWRTIRDAARDAEVIVTTEKDLVKLERFPFARGAIVALRLGVEVDAAEALFAQMTSAIDRVRRE
jgi:tetraacyldisaccharide 4'-kinase